ncbi:glutathione S-transferase N-terminal domain-containing protein [Candidatus Cyanaurora vandensis]|uniref:glutathione S-transferase N-terminal domain-containing protein n=1 Tax=Candidatus Cyanaurora vandensis TaxID=2714958 RepID=UPI00257AB578|nr:glutathione S-transferase N-terminal domain-containing protein [Candidatus Cyanaurora vandensis]
MDVLDLGSSVVATFARLGSSAWVGPLGLRPEQPLALYEFEACPFCRKVREALTILDLEVMVYPCPKGGTRYRPTAQTKGGKLLFPYLVDPNTDRAMYESDDIVRYLFTTYGDGNVPDILSNPLVMVGSGLATVVRMGKGQDARPSRAPEQPLELWSYEASPFCRLVRETLCELEIPYLLHNVSRDSPSRPAFIQKVGKMQVPYLVDPNTGTAMFESVDIQQYLQRTYGV